MNNESAIVNNPLNIVPFPLSPIAILAVKNARAMQYNAKFIMMVGTNDDHMYLGFKAVVVKKQSSLNYHGLRITSNDAILCMNTNGDVKKLIGEISAIFKDEQCIMPSNFDFKNRCAVKKDGDTCIKMSYSALPERFFNYHVSLIGNPKYVFIFSMYKDQYMDSDFYNNHIKEGKPL